MKKLILFIAIALSLIGHTQLTVGVGAIKTDLRTPAINFTISYLQTYDSLYGGKEKVWYGNNSLFAITPDINFEAGTNDAFSSIVAKMTGLAMFYQTKTVAGLETPNTGRLFHTMPMSLGAETNSRFDFVNTILEVGYVPWYQAASTPLWLKRTKVGVFLQGGYKFKLGSTDTSKAVGGQIDQSEESINEGILRAKGSLGIDTKPIIKFHLFKIGLLGSADAWYDFRNSAFYHRLDGRARIYLGADAAFDLIYQKGSGAPLFNPGDQFGVGLNITF